MDLTSLLFSQPVQAVVIKVVADLIKKRLQVLDSSHFAENYGKYLMGAVAVMTALTTALTLVAKHHGADIDTEPFIQYFMQLLTQVYVVHQVTDASTKKLGKSDDPK